MTCFSLLGFQKLPCINIFVMFVELFPVCLFCISFILQYELQYLAYNSGYILTSTNAYSLSNISCVLILVQASSTTLIKRKSCYMQNHWYATTIHFMLINSEPGTTTNNVQTMYVYILLNSILS